MLKLKCRKSMPNGMVDGDFNSREGQEISHCISPLVTIRHSVENLSLGRKQTSKMKDQSTDMIQLYSLCVQDGKAQS